MDGSESNGHYESEQLSFVKRQYEQTATQHDSISRELAAVQARLGDIDRGLYDTNVSVDAAYVEQQRHGRLLDALMRHLGVPYPIEKKP